MHVRYASHDVETKSLTQIIEKHNIELDDLGRLKVRCAGNMFLDLPIISDQRKQARDSRLTLQNSIKADIVNNLMSQIGGKRKKCNLYTNELKISTLPLCDGGFRICNIQNSKPIDTINTYFISKYCGYCMGTREKDDDLDRVKFGSVAFNLHHSCNKVMEANLLFSQKVGWPSEVIPKEVYIYKNEENEEEILKSVDFKNFEKNESHENLCTSPIEENKFIVENNENKCTFCGLEGGVMQYFKLSSFKNQTLLSHIPCIRWMVYSGMLEKWANESFSFDKLSINKHLGKWNCAVCNHTTGWTFRCPIASCAVRAHPICASFNNWDFYLMNDENNKKANLKLFICPFHAPTY